MTIQERNSTIDDMNNEDEITRCKNDILYFVEKYVRIKTDDGDVPLRLTESQKNFLRNPQSYITKLNYLYYDINR
jgi:septum formation topological specificity factor MinE